MKTIRSCLKNRFRYGFTLIELLLVIGIIAILASIVIVAINPTKQLGDARDAQRRSDVNSILNAVYQYAIDNDGLVPDDISATPTEICADAASSCTDLVDLGALTPDYLLAIPADPQETNWAINGAGYEISSGTGGRITVAAPGVEQTGPISVTR